MGKKERIANLELDVDYLMLELEASRREAEELAATISVLEQTIVDQAVSLFGSVRDAGATSVEAGLSPVYGGPREAPADQSWIRFEKP